MKNPIIAGLVFGLIMGGYLIGTKSPVINLLTGMQIGVLIILVIIAKRDK